MPPQARSTALPPDGRPGHETTAFKALLEDADQRLVDGGGEPASRPVPLADDKVCRADWIDEYLIELGIAGVIPSKKNEDGSARAAEFDKDA